LLARRPRRASLATPVSVADWKLDGELLAAFRAAT
jgi:hypothetical protein